MEDLLGLCVLGGTHPWPRRRRKDRLGGWILWGRCSRGLLRGMRLLERFLWMRRRRDTCRRPRCIVGGLL